MMNKYNKTMHNLSIQLMPYIYKVFNYFNGKVNVINSCATVDIIIGPYFDTYAHTDWPYKIRVFPYAILMGVLYDLDGDEKDGKIDIINNFNRTGTWDERYIEGVKSAVVECVVHELFHIDQIYNYDITRDKGQYEKTERDVWSMTYIYINSNIHRIYMDLDLKYRWLDFNPTYNPTDPTHYRRLKEYDYYMQLLEAITIPSFYDSNIELNFSNYLYEEDNIDLIINGIKITIKDNGIFITDNIPYVSKIVYEKYLSYDSAKYNLSYRQIKNSTTNKIILQIIFNIKDTTHQIMTSDDLIQLKESHKKE